MCGMDGGCQLVFQKHKTLFLSNFSRYSICFGAGRLKRGTGRATLKSSLLHGSGKKARMSQHVEFRLLL